MDGDADDVIEEVVLSEDEEDDEDEENDVLIRPTVPIRIRVL